MATGVSMVTKFARRPYTPMRRHFGASRPTYFTTDLSFVSIYQQPHDVVLASPYGQDLDDGAKKLWSRRTILGAIGVGLVPLHDVRSAWAQEVISAPATVAADAIGLIRRSNLSPAWFTSANWGNGAYDPWTDYLIGRMSDQQFQQACPRPTDYCLRDAWDLRRQQPPRQLQATTEPDFNWNGIHALAMRYFRTGEAAYARKWLAVVRFYADWSQVKARDTVSDLGRGMPAPLLEWALIWGGIFTALGIIAKGMPSESGSRPSVTGDAYAPVSSPAFAGASEVLDPGAVIAVAQSFARGAAPLLLRYYSLPRYVPNQRVFGLEAVANLCAFFPRLPGVTELVAPLETALFDVMTRYRHQDGGQLEQSFNYAQTIISSAKRLSGLPIAGDAPWKKEAELTQIGWFRMVRALEVPEGGLPQLGNSTWGQIDRVVPPQRYGVTSVAFPYSGYYAMRSDWTPQAAYLFFFVRRAARGHTMAGGNSIQLAAFGRQLLAAGGSSSYNAAKGNAALARYLAEDSSFKTSTIVVDGKSQKSGLTQGLQVDAQGRPDITVTPRQPLPMRWHTSGHFDYAEGVHDQGYEMTADGAAGASVTDVTHWRQLLFVRPLMMWVVVDVLRTGAAHAYTQIWKFWAPQNGLKVRGFNQEQVALDAQRRVIRTTDAAAGAVNVSLLQFSAAPMGYRSYFGDQRFGHYNPRPLTDAVPAVDVHASWEGRGPQAVITLIAPHRGLRPEIESLRSLTDDLRVGFELTAQRTRLSVLAAATPSRLELGASRHDGADLLAVLESQGGPPAILSIAPSGSRVDIGGERTAITAPGGFRWINDAAGVLRPAY